MWEKTEGRGTHDYVIDSITGIKIQYEPYHPARNPLEPYKGNKRPWTTPEGERMVKRIKKQAELKVDQVVTVYKILHEEGSGLFTVSRVLWGGVTLRKRPKQETTCLITDTFTITTEQVIIEGIAAPTPASFITYSDAEDFIEKQVALAGEEGRAFGMIDEVTWDGEKLKIWF